MRGAALARAGRASMGHDGRRERKPQDVLAKRVPIITESITHSTGHGIAQENVLTKANRLRSGGSSSSSSGASRRGDMHSKDAKAQCADAAANAVVQSSSRTWMQSTVELVGSEGEVYALRPTGERRNTCPRENKIWKVADESVLDVGESSQGSTASGTDSSWDCPPSKANPKGQLPRRRVGQSNRLQAASDSGMKHVQRQRQENPIPCIISSDPLVPNHPGNIKLLNQHQSSPVVRAEQEVPPSGHNVRGCGPELQNAAVLHKDISPDSVSAGTAKDSRRPAAAVPVHVLGSDIPDIAKDQTQLHIDRARSRLRGPSGVALSSQASTSSQNPSKTPNRGLQVAASKNPPEPTDALKAPLVAEGSQAAPVVSASGVARNGQVPVVSRASRSSRSSSGQRDAGSISGGFDRVMVLPATATTWADDTAANIGSPELHGCDGELPQDIRRVLLEALHGSSQDFEAVCCTLREPVPVLPSQGARSRGPYHQQRSPPVDEAADAIVATLRPSALDKCPTTSHLPPDKFSDQISSRLARLDPKWRVALLELLEEAEKKDSGQDNLHKPRQKTSKLLPPSSHPAVQCYKPAKQRQRQS